MSVSFACVFSLVRSTCSYRIQLLEGGWDRAAFCLLWILTKLVERTNEVSLVGRGVCRAWMREPAVCHFGTQVLSASLVCAG